MKTGRISESILKRSVLRQIKTHRDEVLKGAGVGEDCAFFSWDLSETASLEERNSVLAACGAAPVLGRVLAASTQTVTLPVAKAPELAVHAAVNNLAAGGAEPFGITAAITLPADAEEERLKDIMNRLEGRCRALHIELAGGHTEVTPAVNTPVIGITALGKKGSASLGRGVEMPEGLQTEALEETDEAEEQQKACAKAKSSGKSDLLEAEKKDFDIVVSKWIGLEGTVILANDKEEELLGRYPQNLILAAQSFEQYLSVLPEAALALKSGVYMMHDMRNGGIFGALWEISQRIGVGLTIDLKKIPIKQETIEICEYYDLNPYELLSGGGLIMLTEDGKALVKKLEENGISAAVIGSINGSNDKIVMNEEETRYLESPVPDEIYKVFY